MYPGNLLQNLETPILSVRVDRYAFVGVNESKTMFTFTLKLTLIERTPSTSCSFVTEQQKASRVHYNLFLAVFLTNKHEKHQMLEGLILFALLLFFFTQHTQKNVRFHKTELQRFFKN